MSEIIVILCLWVACLCAGVASSYAAGSWMRRMQRTRRHNAALKNQIGGETRQDFQESRDWVLRYAENLTRRLFAGSTEPIDPMVRAKKVGSTRSGIRYANNALLAGCSKSISASAYRETQTRFAITGAFVGALAGSFASLELLIVLCVVLAIVGRLMPFWAIRRAIRRRTVEAELHLSEMLEVVALGLRSGLTFDRSFALYGTHFDNEFARSCTKTYRQWALGLCTREEALRDLASSYNCNQLSRVVDSMVRSLRFGSALAAILEDASVQARVEYRSSLEERIAKAPVKMMLPTGALILPAMLLLIMGPVLLEFTQGF